MTKAREGLLTKAGKGPLTKVGEGLLMKAGEGLLMKAGEGLLTKASTSPEKIRAKHSGRQCWENGSRTGLGEESGKKRLGFVNKSRKGESTCLHVFGII